MTAEASDETLSRQTADLEPQHGPSSQRQYSSGSASDSVQGQRSASLSDDSGAVSENEGAALASESPPQNKADAPLPGEAPPEDDGWQHIWDEVYRAYYFYNRYTQKCQWENPRVPEGSAMGYGSYDRYANGAASYLSTNSGAPGTSPPRKRLYGGYNPAIHGNYDPNADYALEAMKEEEEQEAAAAAAAAAATGLRGPFQDTTVNGQFNRFTGRFQHPSIRPENFNEENKAKRQMKSFFDVDAAANSHDGRSLKAERRSKSLTKKELQAFKAKRREKKEEKRRAWLMD